jgi:hypothetical protein
MCEWAGIFLEVQCSCSDLRNVSEGRIQTRGGNPLSQMWKRRGAFVRSGAASRDSCSYRVRYAAAYVVLRSVSDARATTRTCRTTSSPQEIVARLSPRPDVPASVRKLPALRLQAFPPSEAPTEAPVAPDAPATDPGAPDPAASAPPETAVTAEPVTVPRAAVTPLAPDRYKLQLTIGGETLEMLRLAKDMLSHAIPSGDDAAVLDLALTALLVDLAKKKFADTRNPRGSRAKDARARDASAAVKRTVWVRDVGRCKFIGPNGHRCNERRFAEFHHVDPYALGGEATVDEIELRCRRHNDYEGRLYFGKRRRDDTGAVREKGVAYGAQPFEPANSFQNKLAGGASPSTRSASVEPQR